MFRLLKAGALIGALIVALLAAASLEAASHSWTGAGPDAKWSTAANWSGGAPQAGEGSLVLGFPAGPAELNPVNDLPGLAVTSINFSGTGYTLSGLGISLSGGISFSADNTVHLDIQLTATQTFAGPFGVTSPQLYVSGVLSGAPAVELRIDGAVHLSGANAYEGPTKVVNGTLHADSSQALGSPAAGTTVTTNQRLQLNGSIVVPEPVTVQTGSIIATGSPTLSGPLSYTGQILVYPNAYTEKITITGVISGAGTLYIQSGGQTTFTAANTYTGQTSVSGSGTLRVDGNQAQSAVYMNAGGTLYGTGTVGPVTQNLGGGQINPGAFKVPGKITISGNLQISGAGTKFMSLDLGGTNPGTEHDQIVVTGNADITNMNLFLYRIGPVPVGTPLTVLTCGGTLTGTFATLPEGATKVAGGQTFQVHYTANAVTFTATTPSPNTPPGFSAATSSLVHQGQSVTGAVLGTVSDPETAAGSLNVSLAQVPAGVTVTNLANAGGTVTADLAASCGAPLGTFNVGLSVSDGTDTTPANGSVTVNADAVAPAVTAPATTSTLVRQTTCTPSRGVTLAGLQAKDAVLFGAWQALVSAFSATDGCTNPPVQTLRFQGSDVLPATFFAAGQAHPIQVRFTDAAGNAGTSSLTLRVAYEGDVTLDDVVDIFDLVAVSNEVVGNVQPGVAPYLSPISVGDVDGNGVVDLFDTIVLQAFIVGNVPCLTP